MSCPRYIASLGIALLIPHASSLAAAQRILTYETDTDRYRLTFDDRRIPMDEMKRIAWLSPYMPPDVPSPFEMASSYDGATDHWEKTIGVRPLERCMPGYAECHHPVLNAAFFENASRNLEIGRKQEEALRDEALPRVLEPVRAYLLGTLRFFLGIEQARYEFLKTNNADALRSFLCKYCPCGEAEGDLIARASRLEGTRKREFTGHTLYNHVLDCQRAHDPGYPLASWKAFIAQFGIKEEHKFLRVD